MDEKRKYRRIPTDAVIIYQIQNYPEGAEEKLQKVGAPVSVDISEGGLQLLTKQPLQKDIYLRINLSLPSQKAPLELTGKVVWVREEKTRFNTGVKFVDFDNEEQREILKRYISQKIQGE